MGIQSVPEFEKEPTLVYLSVEANLLPGDDEAGPIGIVIPPLSGTDILTTLTYLKNFEDILRIILLWFNKKSVNKTLWFNRLDET